MSEEIKAIELEVVDKNISTRSKLKKFARKNWILILGIIYILIPIDFIPEAILGPLGIVDDAGVMIGALITQWLSSKD